MTTEHAKPTIGRIVWYRGKEGLEALRPAMVVTTVGTLAAAGVTADPRLALTDEMHVHLHVFTPSDRGFFTEYDVPYDDETTGDDERYPQPGKWAWPRRV